MPLRVHARTRSGKAGALESEFGQIMQKFDQLVDAVLRGGTVDGVKIIATTNKDLVQQIAEAQKVHDQLALYGKEIIAQHRRTLQAGATKLAETEVKAARRWWGPMARKAIS